MFGKEQVSLEKRLLINLGVTEPLDISQISSVKYLNWSKLEIQLMPVKFNSSDS